MDSLEEIAHSRLRRGESRLHPARRRAPFAEMEQPHSGPFDLGELNHRLCFLADIANHVSLPSFAVHSPVKTELNPGANLSHHYVTNDRIV